MPIKTKGVRRIWIQAVSVGELLAVGPLLRKFSENESIEIVLSTTTSTGYQVARDRYADLALAIGPFPIDFLPCSHRTWNRIRPDLVILVDSELWPEHLWQAKKRDVPALIVNARLSERSSRRLGQITCFRNLLVPPQLHVMACSKQNAEKWRQVGVSPHLLEISGNLKFDYQPEVILDESEKMALRDEFGFSSAADQARPIILFGASTWPGEEDALLRFMEQNEGEGTPVRLVIAPRHAERGDEIAQLLDNRSLPWRRRSTEKETGNGEAMVYLADTTGELSRLVQTADLVFVGKTLSPNEGGQNPIEAASCGIPLIFGPNTQNFSEMARTLVEAGAGLRVSDANALQKVLPELLGDQIVRAEMGAAASHWKTEQEGASSKTYDKVIQLLESHD
ncbi:MAG: glycosyltransferase N-terminal domain-containing protein [Opitutales bacterium]